MGEAGCESLHAEFNGIGAARTYMRIVPVGSVRHIVSVGPSSGPQPRWGRFLRPLSRYRRGRGAASPVAGYPCCPDRAGRCVGLVGCPKNLFFEWYPYGTHSVFVGTVFSRNPLFYWCRLRGLNSRPSVYKTVVDRVSHRAAYVSAGTCRRRATILLRKDWLSELIGALLWGDNGGAHRSLRVLPCRVFAWVGLRWCDG